MKLSEAEIQVLASLKEAKAHGQPTDRETLERRGQRYGAYKEDWAGAFSSLTNRGLLQSDGKRFSLTVSGRPLADAYCAERPNASWYHYQRFYAIAHASAAHSRFCERVYGRDLCQDGQTDMKCLDGILGRLELTPGDHALDLGCGAGGLSEYLAEHTGARVTGVDNSASAIETANVRTTGKRDRLAFIKADMNSLDLPARSFDVALSIDSISWVTDMTPAVSSFVRCIKPGGQLCILTEHRLSHSDPPEAMKAHHTPVAETLSALQLNYEVHDHTESLLDFWTLARETAVALRADFSREGADFICDTWMALADQTYLPAIHAKRIRRYLYHAHA